jgi:SPP1 gp7 family putative phage head morphogenesis protein
MDLQAATIAMTKHQMLIEAAAAKDIIRAYTESLDNIRLKISKLYEQYAKEGALSFAEMAKFQRLTKLEQFITEDLKPAFLKVEGIINKVSIVRYNSSFYRSAFNIDKFLKVALNWGVLNPDTVKASIGITEDYTRIKNPVTKEYAAYNHKLRYEAMRGLKSNALKKLKTTISQGFIQGLSYDKMARSIKGVFNKQTLYEAMRIMRTEGTRAQTLGTMESYDTARKLGVNVVNVWDATLDRKTRPEHAALDQVEANEDNMFETEIGLITGPGLSGVASFDINCRCVLTPKVDGEGPVIAKSREDGYIPNQTFREWAEDRGVTVNKYGQKYAF